MPSHKANRAVESRPAATFDSELRRHKSSKKPLFKPPKSRRLFFVPLFSFRNGKTQFYLSFRYEMF